MSTREAHVKMSDIVNSIGMAGRVGPLDKLLGAKLPTGLSFRLSMLIDEVSAPVKRYNEHREAVVRELAPDGYDKLEGEARTQVDEKFQAAMEELGQQEVTIRVPVIRPSELDNYEILSPAECRTLRWLFVEGESAAAAG